MRNLISTYSVSVIVYACLLYYFVDGFPNGFHESDRTDGRGALLKPRLIKRSTANMVDIAMFEDSSAPGKMLSIYVDDTMSRLIIQVEVEGSDPVMMILKPSGIPGPQPALNTTSGTRIHIGTIDTAITAADHGIWKIMKMNASKWTVKVKGESHLDFSYQFLEGTMFKMPIAGNPIQGKPYTAIITVPHFELIQRIEMVMIFVIAKAYPANILIPKDEGGGRFETSFKMPDQEFMLGIHGKDKSGHFLRRVVFIKPMTLSLYVPSYAGVKLYENAEIDIFFSVMNELSIDQEIDIRIEDTRKFAQPPIFMSVLVTPGANFTEKFVIKGGMAGETTIATITARQYLGHGKFSLGPSEVRQFTVERSVTGFVSSSPISVLQVTTQPIVTRSLVSSTAKSSLSTPTANSFIPTSSSSTAIGSSSYATATLSDAKASLSSLTASSSTLKAYPSTAIFFSTAAIVNSSAATITSTAAAKSLATKTSAITSLTTTTAISSTAKGSLSALTVGSSTLTVGSSTLTVGSSTAKAISSGRSSTAIHKSSSEKANLSTQKITSITAAASSSVMTAGSAAVKPLAKVSASKNPFNIIFNFHFC